MSKPKPKPTTFHVPFAAAALVSLALAGCGDDERPPGATTFGSVTTSASGTGTSAGQETGTGSATESATTTAGDGDGDATTSTTTGDGDGDGDPGVTGTPTEENLRVAFIGDQSLSGAANAVLDLVVAEGADFLIIAGDFDYDSNPSAWDNMNVSRLGADYPMFAVAGNHDEDAFYGNDGYQTKISERIQNALDDGGDCSGELGLNSACHYKGLFMVFSGVDVYNGQAESEAYIRDQLSNDDAIWSICAWHKNQNDMQAGGKGNETGWGVYQACQDGGAIIVTGHEHSYARTRVLTDVGNAANGHGAVGEFDVLEVGPGQTFVTVSGIGGQGLRDYHADEHDDDTWWSTIYASDHYRYMGEEVANPDPKQGALFIDFNVDGDPTRALGYFKTIDGDVVDEFEIVRVLGNSGGGDGDGDPTTTGGEEPDLELVTFDDATVDSEAPNQNFGSNDDLLVDQSPVYETFIKPIGLDAIAPGTPIASATLTLVSFNPGDTVEVRPVNADWSEGTITFNNKPATGAVLTTFAAGEGIIEVDITSIVQSWVDGQANYGIQLRSEGSNGSDYYSTENGFDGPRLEVWYL